jgi:rhomboid protease GluP
VTRARSQLCPWCKRLVAPGDPRCLHCGRRQPGPLARLAFDLAETAGASGAPVTILVVLVNLAVFAATHSSARQLGSALLTGATLPRMVASGAILLPLTASEPWRMVSAGWVHFGLIHIGFNLFALVRFGTQAERLVGPSRYALAYVATGVAGFAVSVALSGGRLYTGGASASVFGLEGLLLGTLAARHDPAWKQYVVYTVVSALAFGMLPGMSVNNSAHMGGLAAGIAFGWAFARERRPWRHDAAFRVLGALSALAVLASLALARKSPITELLLLEQSRRDLLEGLSP